MRTPETKRFWRFGLSWSKPLPPTWAIAVSGLYGRSARWVRIYESLLQAMVWGIVVCFGWVVFETGIDDWGALGRGFLAFDVPADRNGIAAATINSDTPSPFKSGATICFPSVESCSDSMPPTRNGRRS